MTDNEGGTEWESDRCSACTVSVTSVNAALFDGTMESQGAGWMNVSAPVPVSSHSSSLPVHANPSIHHHRWQGRVVWVGGSSCKSLAKVMVTLRSAKCGSEVTDVAMVITV